MASMHTSAKYAVIDRTRGLAVSTYATRKEMVADLLHTLDEPTLRWIEKEIVVAIEELHTGDRLATPD